MKKSVLVAIVGKPNAGKSTLMNSIIDYRLSIVTPKVQTTRNIIRGILTKDQTQFIFFDTPGIFKPKNNLEKLIVKHAWDSLKGVDVVVLMIDGTKELDDETKELCARLHKSYQLVIAINKKDIGPTKAGMIHQLGEIAPEAHIMPISALQKDGVNDLLNYVEKSAVQSSWIYDEDLVTNLPLKFLTSEITREQLFLNLGQELPYNLTVLTEEMTKKEGDEYIIKQTIIVSKESHKKIIIGKKGDKIKAINQKARSCMEEYLGIKVHLFLFVSVKNWLNAAHMFV